MPQTTPSMSFASAVTRTEPADAALGEIVAKLTKQLDHDADLLIVFATPEYTDAMESITDALRQAFDARHVLGSTAQGVVGTGQELEEGPGISVLAGVLPGACLKPVRYDPIDYPSVIDSPTALCEATGITPGDHQADADAVRCLMLIVDPFSTPLAGLVPSLNQAMPGVPLIGGLASGGRKPRGNRLILDDKVYRDGAVGLTISGDVSVQVTVSQGCRPIGRPWVITKAKRHVVQELGGRKALDVLRQTVAGLTERDRELAQSTGLQVGRVINEYKRHFGRGDFLVRGIIGVDPDGGYLAIGDPRVRVGQTVQFQIRDGRTATQDLRMMLDAQRVHGAGEAGLLFTCVDRGSRLFADNDNDARMIDEALGEVPLAGFFTSGEFGPVGGENHVHGQTACLAVFRNADA